MEGTLSPHDWVAEHTKKYIETDGEEGYMWHGMPTLLLTTTGRRSGVPRTTALIFGQDGDNYVLIASDGGSDHHPQWYLNMLEQPEVQLQIRADKFRALTRTASAEEKTRIWPMMSRILPNYDVYQQKAARDIPLVILERIKE